MTILIFRNSLYFTELNCQLGIHTTGNLKVITLKAVTVIQSVHAYSYQIQTKGFVMSLLLGMWKKGTITIHNSTD